MQISILLYYTPLHLHLDIVDLRNGTTLYIQLLCTRHCSLRLIFFLEKLIIILILLNYVQMALQRLMFCCNKLTEDGSLTSLHGGLMLTRLADERNDWSSIPDELRGNFLPRSRRDFSWVKVSSGPSYQPSQLPGHVNTSPGLDST